MRFHEEKLLEDAIGTAVKAEIENRILKIILLAENILFLLLLIGEILWIVT